MARNVYECMYIFDSNRYARDPGAIAKLANDLIEEQGGQVLASRLWNEQRLAYPIDGHRKGTYWLTYFSMESTSVKDFNRQCEIREEVLRHLTLKVDPRLSDTLVAYARGEMTTRPLGEPAGLQQVDEYREPREPRERGEGRPRRAPVGDRG